MLNVEGEKMLEVIAIENCTNIKKSLQIIEQELINVQEPFLMARMD